MLSVPFFCICGPAGILVRFSYLYEYRGFLALGRGLVRFSLVPKGITLCKGSVIRIFFVRPANRTCRWTVRPNARCIHIFLLHCKILPPPLLTPAPRCPDFVRPQKPDVGYVFLRRIISCARAFVHQPRVIGPAKGVEGFWLAILPFETPR